MNKRIEMLNLKKIAPKQAAKKHFHATLYPELYLEGTTDVRPKLI